MSNISVEQQFPDPAYVLNLVLSALGQDPQHDFDNDGGRTFSKGGDDCNNSIASDMIKLLELCKARAQQSGGSKKYKQKGGDGEGKMQQIVLRGSMNEIEIVADETSRSMVRNITTSIFADGIKLALSSEHPQFTHILILPLFLLFLILHQLLNLIVCFHTDIYQKAV